LEHLTNNSLVFDKEAGIIIICLSQESLSLDVKAVNILELITPQGLIEKALC
jgi:hypothetical protein